MKNNFLLKAGITSAVVMLSGMGSSKAGLQLTHDPLFLSQSVPPAIVVTMDDSGSMAWGYLGRNYGNGDCRSWDPNLNALYYNPNTTYLPAMRADGTPFPNSNPSAARMDPFGSRTTTVNLFNNYRPVWDMARRAGGTTPNITYGANIPAQRAYYTQYNPSANNCTIISVPGSQMQNFANWYTYYNIREKAAKTASSRAFAQFGEDFKLAWQELNNLTTITSFTVLNTVGKNAFFNWLLNVPSWGGTPLGTSFDRAGRKFMQNSSYQDINNPGQTLSCQQNFHIAISDGEWNGTVGSIGSNDHTPSSRLAGDNEGRYGAYNFAAGSEQAIYNKRSTNSGNSGTRGAPIVDMADIAFHYWQTDLMPGLTNNVKRFKKDYTDRTGANITVPTSGDEWDVPAFVWNPKNNPAYWQHLVTYNVGLGLESDTVRAQRGTSPRCPAVSGLTPEQSVYRGLRSDACDWTPIITIWDGSWNYIPGKVDDIWQSSINSRGDFFSAKDPQELTDALNEVVSSILERLTRGASSSVSSSVITSGSLAFSPGFDSSNWTGLLTAKRVANDGSFVTPAVWDLACNLTGGECSSTGQTATAKQATRNIYAYDADDEDAVRFSNPLDSDVEDVIKGNINEMSTRLGIAKNQLVKDIVDYVNGDQAKEQSNGGKLRTRESVLSDIIHGSPVILRGPSESYDDSLWPEGSDEKDAADNGKGYLDFQIANKNRENMVFVGSNSGMLHAVKAESGEELWGYIPAAAVDNIHKLADPKFEHWSFVDNTPVIGDAFFDNKWHSVLIGGMRYGGRSFFAIDVTDGVDDSEPEVLWEFSEKDDPDMRYSYGQAQIVRISSTGKWVALIPNGYTPNSTPALSGTGHAVLFVVDLEDGDLIAKLDTGVGSPSAPNGLATPVAVDSAYFQGGNVVTDLTKGVDIGTDYAYAGDLYGNLWRFDLTDTNPDNWKNSITKVVAGSKERPITIQPRVVRIPEEKQSIANDVVVIFGTGKYIESPDRSTSIGKQFLVGVYDGLGSPSAPANSDLNFLGGSFVEQEFTSSSDRRVLSAHPVDLITNDGWRIKLPDNGERIANPMTLFGSHVMMVPSTIPGGQDPCIGGGTSWLMATDPVTGGKPAVDVFARVAGTTAGPNGTQVTLYEHDQGVKVNDLIVGSPSFLENQGGGNVNVVIEGFDNVETINIQKFTWRRRNWTNLLTE